MRLQLFKLDTPESLKFTACDEKCGCGAKFKILKDVQNFQIYSKQLLKNSSHIDTLIERVLGRHILGLPEVSSGRDQYSYRKLIEKENIAEDSSVWVEQYKIFLHLMGYTLGSVRFSKACSEFLDTDLDITQIAAKWEVCANEVVQIASWYKDRGKKLYGVLNTDSNMKLWYSSSCDEEARFRDLFPELRNHASRLLAKGSFRYLSDLYEGRDELTWQLMDRAWQAIVFTAHKSPTDSLKLAKSYINTEIHHLAVKITKDNTKQAFNIETGIYEIKELGLIDNQEMDPSKHEFLWFEDEGFAVSEIQHTLDMHLTPKENELVKVLGGFIDNPAFEEYAKTKPDRRMACFEYYGILEQDLKDILPGLLCGDSK